MKEGNNDSHNGCNLINSACNPYQHLILYSKCVISVRVDEGCGVFQVDGGEGNLEEKMEEK